VDCLCECCICVCLEGACGCDVCVCVVVIGFRFVGMRVGVLLIYFVSVLCFFVESCSMFFVCWLLRVHCVARFCVW